MSTRPLSFFLRCAFAASLAAIAPATLLSQGFATMVTPPRFELAAKAAKTERHVIEIMNADLKPATYRVRTADWTLDEKATVQLHDTLQAGSCRQWVAIERREVTVASNARYRYRFEVTPPPDAKGECRFAIVLAAAADTVNAGQNIQIPVNGQIAVIVYLTFDGAAPQLEIVGSAVKEREGRIVPVIAVKNSGEAHGRLAGFLEGTDASGRRFQFTPSGLPILAGETRDIPLDIATEGNERPVVAFPIAIRGTLEWNGKSTPFEARFAP